VSRMKATGPIRILGQGPSKEEQEASQARIMKTTNAILPVLACGTIQISEGIDSLVSALGALLAQAYPKPEDAEKAKAALTGPILNGALHVYEAEAPRILDMQRKEAVQ